MDFFLVYYIYFIHFVNVWHYDNHSYSLDYLSVIRFFSHSVTFTFFPYIVTGTIMDMEEINYLKQGRKLHGIEGNRLNIWQFYSILSPFIGV